MAAQLRLERDRGGWSSHSGGSGDGERPGDLPGAARKDPQAGPPYSDAIGREINLERQNIVERLAPFLISKLSQAGSDETLKLFPWEVDH